MGQTLSEPVVEKLGEDGGDDRLIYGLSTMQGWRITMEDAHAAILDLQSGENPTPKPKDQRISFFGVYDGHGGDKVALFSGENVHQILTKQAAFEKGNFEQALKDGFLATDRAILQDARYEDEVSGCTASAALVTDKQIYVANAGDSRTVLGVKGRAKPLSFDHKPQNEGEKARITAAGGFVDFGRVNGNLALSRAIGDFEFKKSADLPPEQQIVTAYPDVVVHDITDDDEFIVVACDGIWDCQSSQAVVEFVRRGIAARQSLQEICENMMDNCLASSSDTGGVGCDNMTMMIVGLLGGRTKEEWYETIVKRVEEGDGPCAPPEYAERRGIKGRKNFEESGDDQDEGNSSIRRGVGRGRIIMLGDGTEVLTDSDDVNMVDQSKDDDDEALQKPSKSDDTEKSDAGSEKVKLADPGNLLGKTEEKKEKEKTASA